MNFSVAAAARWVFACACASTLIAGGMSAATEPPAPLPQAPAEPEDYWTGPINAPVPAAITGGTVIHTAELKELLARNGIVLVEVSNAPLRPENLAPGAPWLPKPHTVIPGSVWIPGAGMGTIAADVEETLRDRLRNATGNELDRPIVIYCHEQCWLSWNAAKRAIRMGYRGVHWYPEGIEGWRAAGLETASIAESAAATPAAP